MVAAEGSGRISKLYNMASNPSPSTSSANDLAPPMNIPLPLSKVPLCAPSSPDPEPLTVTRPVRTSTPSFATLAPYEAPRPKIAKPGGSRASNYPSTLLGEAETFVKFYTVRSTASADLRRLNLFKVDKAVCGAIGEPARITENSDHTLTVEVKSHAQGQKLQSMKTLVQEPIEVVPHQRYNQSQGVITCDLLRSYSDDDIVEGLSHLGITKVYRIKKRSPTGTLDPTSTLILTFNTAVSPDRIRIRAGLSERVRPYVPLPRRCYKCQQYGHVTKNCRSEQEMCGRCGVACSDTHLAATCQRPLNCIHCQEPHSTSSKVCSRYSMEKEIISVKVKERLTFREARHRVMAMFPVPARTFSSAVRSQPRRTQPAVPQTPIQTMRQESVQPQTSRLAPTRPKASRSASVESRLPRPAIGLTQAPTNTSQGPLQSLSDSYNSPRSSPRQKKKRQSPSSPPLDVKSRRLHPPSDEEDPAHVRMDTDVTPPPLPPLFRAQTGNLIELTPPERSPPKLNRDRPPPPGLPPKPRPSSLPRSISKDTKQASSHKSKPSGKTK